MVRTHNRLYFILPLVYAGLFFLFVVIQFSKNESFSQNVGDLVVSGKASAGQGGDEVVDLMVRGRGLSLNFSAGTPVLLETTDGTIHRARPRSFTVNQGRQTITLEFQHRLRVVILQSGSRLQLRSTVLENPETIRSISLPLTAEEVPTSLPGFLPALELRSGTSNRGFLVLSGAGDQFNREKGYLVLNAQKGVLGTLTLDSQTGGNAGVLEAWLYGVGREASDPQGLWKDFWSKAYTGWHLVRYSAGDWGRPGAGSFSDGLAALYYKSSLDQGTAALAVPRIAAGARLRGSTWASAPYSGNVIESLRLKRRDMEVLAQNLNAGQAANWAENPWIIRDAWYHGSGALFQALKKQALEGLIQDTAEQTTGLLSALVQLPALDRTENRNRTLWALERLVRKIAIVQGQAWVVNSKGFLDLKETAGAGLVLGHLAAKEEWASWRPLAWALQGSVLSQAGANGIIPRILLVEKDGSLKKEGQFYPEELYPYWSLVSSPPGEISLSDSWGTGAFLKTSEAFQTMKIGADEAVFTFKQPQGATHHLVIQNVPEFASISLHGIRWRPDPSFQLYSEGYFYNLQTRTLYVKLFHRTETVDVKVRFTPEAPAP